MKLTPLLGNSQRLDGGAMFGNVPKAIWRQWITPDADNRIPLACRALLVETGEQTILLETGIGRCFNPVLSQRFGIEEPHHVLLENLKALGLTEDDIDIVILSHLHFDHAGGLLSAYQEGEAQRLLFNRAKYLVSEEAWRRACHPHPRDKASFIPLLNTLLDESGRLHLINQPHSDLLGHAFEFTFSNGHTPGLMHTIIKPSQAAPIVFASDLIPGHQWVHLPVTMGYDRCPETLIDEKKQLLDWVIANQAQLFYTHDLEVVYSGVKNDESGKYSPVINN